MADINSNQDASNNPLYALGLGAAIVGGVSFAQRKEEPGERKGRGFFRRNADAMADARTASKQAKQAAREVMRAEAWDQAGEDLVDRGHTGSKLYNPDTKAFFNTGSIGDVQQGNRILHDMTGSDAQDLRQFVKSDAVQKHVAEMSKRGWWGQKQYLNNLDPIMSESGRENLAQRGLNDTWNKDAAVFEKHLNPMLEETGATKAERKVMKAILRRMRV